VQLRKPPEAVRDRLLYEQVERRFNVIGEYDFQKVIEKTTPLSSARLDDHARTN
jgi:hypothetical protein